MLPILIPIPFSSTLIHSSSSLILHNLFHLPNTPSHVYYVHTLFSLLHSITPFNLYPPLLLSHHTPLLTLTTSFHSIPYYYTDSHLTSSPHTHTPHSLSHHILSSQRSSSQHNPPFNTPVVSFPAPSPAPTLPTSLFPQPPFALRVV